MKIDRNILNIFIIDIFELFSSNLRHKDSWIVKARYRSIRISPRFSKFFVVLDPVRSFNLSTDLTHTLECRWSSNLNSATVLAKVYGLFSGLFLGIFPFRFFERKFQTLKINLGCKNEVHYNDRRSLDWCQR